MREHEGGDHDGQRRAPAASSSTSSCRHARPHGLAPVTDQGEDTEVVGAGMHSAGVDPAGVAPAEPPTGPSPCGRPAGVRSCSTPRRACTAPGPPQRRDGAPVFQRTRVVARASGGAIPVRRKVVGRGDDAPLRACAPDGEQDAGRVRHEGARHPDPPGARRHHGSIVATARPARPGPAVRNAPLQPHRLGNQRLPTERGGTMADPARAMKVADRIKDRDRRGLGQVIRTPTWVSSPSPTSASPATPARLDLLHRLR